MNADNKKLIIDGLWKNNAGLVQLLGLCPLLAVTGTLINGLGLGLATLMTLLISNSLVSALRFHVKDEIRIPVFVLIIASTVSAIELAMQAWWFELHSVLGIFIPLIVTNCAIIGRAEAFASRNNVPAAALDGVSMGMGFTLVLMVLGGLRELIGQGTLFNNAHLLFGETAKQWTLYLSDDYPNFLLAVLPPGAFFGLGLLIAFKNMIDARQEKLNQQIQLESV